MAHDKTLTISCSADADMAQAIFDHLQSNLYSKRQNEIELETDEILVKNSSNENLHVAVIDAISSFVKSRPEYENCQVSKFDDVIIVGIPVNSGQLLDNLAGCDMCDYKTPYEEQLRLHRMTHGNVFLG